MERGRRLRIPRSGLRLEDLRHGTAIRQRALAAPLVVVDGDCALCAAATRFIEARSAPGTFAFVARESPAGRAALAPYPAAGSADALVLIEDGAVTTGSDAVVRIAVRLRAPWPAIGALRVLPRALRETVYRFVARNRYRWFGRVTNG